MPYIVGMDVVTGTDTSTSPAGVDRLLVGIRHLTSLADAAGNAEAMFRALADELLSVPGAEEVHVHHLVVDGESEDEPVVVYVDGGVGRLSYLRPRAERPPGVSWVASTRRSFLASDPQELAASVPRLAQTIVNTPAVTSGWNDVPGMNGATNFANQPIKTVPDVQNYFSNDVIPVLADQRGNYDTLTSISRIDFIGWLVLAIGVIVILYGVVMVALAAGWLRGSDDPATEPAGEAAPAPS